MKYFEDLWCVTATIALSNTAQARWLEKYHEFQRPNISGGQKSG